SALNRSAFTTNLNCSTSGCGTGQGECTFTFSAWKTLIPICDPGADIIVRTASTPALGSTLTLGTVIYPDTRLACILDTAAGDNGLIALAHQLIAAKLNAAKNGSVPASTATCISDADALIGDLVIPPLGFGFLDPSATSALTSCLANYNEGAVGPGACLPPASGFDMLRVR